MTEHQVRLGISLAVGLAPALVLMWLSLRRFDYPLAPKALFDDRRVFLAFAVGMVFGVVASVLTITLSISGLGAIVPLVAIAFFEESFKVVYLNRPGYRGRFDTTFYGAALGVGSAATLATASVYIPNPFVGDRPEVIAYLAAFSASLSLALASTGSLIGFGAAHSQMLRYFVRAFLVRVSHLLLLLFFFVGDDLALSVFSLAASLVFASVVYVYVYREVLPETLPGDIRRSLTRWPGKAKRPVKGSE